MFLSWVIADEALIYVGHFPVSIIIATREIRSCVLAHQENASIMIIKEINLVQSEFVKILKPIIQSVLQFDAPTFQQNNWR